MAKYRVMEDHFGRVASVYDYVRNTDPIIFDEIVAHLPRVKRPIDVADIGCGTGRYSKIIAKRLNNNLRLFCCDNSKIMLANCRKKIQRQFPFTKAHCCLTKAGELAFGNDCFDAVVTFNAIHHFDLDRFVELAAHTLRLDGLLCIYTRTPEQNARTIWGRHFPKFTKYETRLYTVERIEEAIGDVGELKLEVMKELKHVRIESAESLLNRVRNAHYSTFALYPKHELQSAVETFGKRLADLSDNGAIKHTAENTMILARRK